MRIIKIKSCKTCPYRKVGIDGSVWSLKCGKQYISEIGFVRLSFSSDKKLLNYTIPEECPLDKLE